MSAQGLLNIVVFFIVLVVLVVVVVCHGMIIHTVFKLNIKIILHLCHLEKTNCSGTWHICAISQIVVKRTKPYTTLWCDVFSIKITQ
jgi:hypothetical protein